MAQCNDAFEQLNAIVDTAITFSKARSDAAANDAVTPFALMHATAVQTTLTADAAVIAITACADDDEDSDANLNTIAKGRC